MSKWIVIWMFYGGSINVLSWIWLLYIVLFQAASNPEDKIEFWYLTSEIITLGPSWPWRCRLKPWMQNSTNSFEISKIIFKDRAITKQSKALEKFPLNRKKGVCNTLWNISCKVQLVAQVPGLIFSILGVKILHCKSACNNAF